ncbi:hypothetical protein SAMN04489761_4348 [Tenacibaculum sp. MAR_2009_124]|nr:hypothetical protein SAMN04489761_4348 [Tenacibaculum sp. MAR_2009_124]
MEEVAFKVLSETQDVIKVDNFVRQVIDFTNNSEITYEDVRESIFKFMFYRFIKVENTSAEENYICKEQNFYQAKKLGSVGSWLKEKQV